MPKLNEIISANFNLSPSVLERKIIDNKNRFLLMDLLDRKLIKKDNGSEIGSSAYLKSSTHFFLKTKALKENYYTPFISDDSAVPMNPKKFVNYNLQKGDLIISKDSNIGECVILDKDLNNVMLSGALYKLPITKFKNYIFAFIKSKHYKQQLDELVPKGATIRHAGKRFLDCHIYFPNYSIETNEYLLKTVENIVDLIINKEQLIKDYNEKIFKLILNEIERNTISEKNLNTNSIARFNDIKSIGRLDASYHSKLANLQKNMISNYKFGNCSLEKLGYKMKRGQNLQITNIGKSIYSDEYKDGFYTVIKPTNFTEYGTVKDYEYLGNKNILQTLEDGDIVFSAEGTVGKCVLFTKTNEKWITNIHGIVLKSETHNRVLSAYISCILRFYKDWGYFEHFTVGGQGGSLGKNYWDEILIPLFPNDLQTKIAHLYHNPNAYTVQYDNQSIIEFDKTWNQSAGIIELMDSIIKLKQLLNFIIDSIVKNIQININVVENKINKIYTNKI